MKDPYCPPHMMNIAVYNGVNFSGYFNQTSWNTGYEKLYIWSKNAEMHSSNVTSNVSSGLFHWSNSSEIFWYCKVSYSTNCGLFLHGI